MSRGTTPDGRGYEILTSEAEGQRCIAVEYTGFADGSQQKGPLRVGGTEACLPVDRALGATSDQIFFDPRTGEMTDKPLRFVYGIVTDDVAAVLVKAPDGDTRSLEITDIPGRPYSVFAGAPPAGSPVGEGSVIAENAAGERLASDPMRFAGPAHQSDADAQAEARSPFHTD